MPKAATVGYGVLCDTSFFIRWARPHDPLHAAAQAYLKFLVDGDHELYVSTIALAEYAVRDSIANLPLRYFRILPFNVDHAQRAGEFAREVFDARNKLPVHLDERVVIPNDTKMFAQADVKPEITHYLTADQKCEKVYNLLETVLKPRFKFTHLSTPWHKTFGHLDMST